MRFGGPIDMTRNPMAADARACLQSTLKIYLIANVQTSQACSRQGFVGNIGGKMVLIKRNHRQAYTRNGNAFAKLNVMHWQAVDFDRQANIATDFLQ